MAGRTDRERKWRQRYHNAKWRRWWYCWAEHTANEQ